MRITPSTGGRKLAADLSKTDYDLSVVSGATDVAGTTTTRVDKDANLITYTSAYVRPSAKIQVTQNANSDSAVTYESLTPTVATVDSAGNLTVLSSGQCLLSATPSGKKKKVHRLPVTAPYVAASTVVDSWVPGSLSRHVHDAFSAAITGKTVTYQGVHATHQLLFSASNATNAWTRNPNHVLSAVDLTGISAPRNYAQDGWNGGTCATAISPQHIISANHWHLEVGRVHYFVTADNQVISRTLTGGMRVGSTDIWIGHLDAPLPASIKPMKILPANFATKLPQRTDALNDRIYQVPAALVFNASGDIHVGGFIDWSTGLSEFSEFPGGQFRNWYKGGTYGSGSVVFTVINSEPVLLFCLYLAGYLGPAVHKYASEINTAMTTLHGSVAYQLSYVDLTGFTSF